MSLLVKVKPRLFEWARARSGIDDETWASRFPRYHDWLSGERKPTLRQLEEFARKSYTPVGYFLLDEPPHEEVPIPDFRTVGDRPAPTVVSADLLDTLYVCQARQEWYRDNQLLNGEQPLAFVDSATKASDPGAVAGQMRAVLDWARETRDRLGSWYGFDLCPGFWQWLEKANAAGVVHSVDAVYSELTAGDDDLAQWAKDHEGFFLPTTAAELTAIAAINRWANNSPDYKQAAKNEFAKAADSYLIGHAVAGGHTVVTHEVSRQQRTKIKIPNAADANDVPHVNLFQMLRTEGARFVLDP